MRSLLFSLFIAALLFVAGCARRHDASNAAEKTSDVAAVKPASGEPEQKKDDSIGAATMLQDGTIILNLRAESPGKIIGDGRLVYRKTDKGYSDVLKHLGGMKPGETKSVPPWPDQP